MAPNTTRQRPTGNVGCLVRKAPGATSNFPRPTVLMVAAESRKK